MARSSKTTASTSGGGIKARGRPAKKTSEPRKKKTEASRKTVPRPRRHAKGDPQKPLRLNPEPVQAGVKRGDGPQQTPHLAPGRPPRNGRTHLASGARRRAHLALRRPPRSGRTYLASGARRRARLAPRRPLRSGRTYLANGARRRARRIGAAHRGRGGRRTQPSVLRSRIQSPKRWLWGRKL